MAFGILGTGSSYPERILTNQDLEKIVETSDEWIRTRSGVVERHILPEDEATSDMAARAGKKAIEAAGLSPADIDLIIVCTFSPDTLVPCTACYVMEKIGIPNCAAFDLNAACTGFIYGLSAARGMITCGVAHKALVIGADAVTRYTNWKDRGTCVLFGDAAGAVVLGEVEDGSGILSEYLSADGRMNPHIIIPAGGSRIPTTHEVIDNDEQKIHMNGKEVFKFAIQAMPNALLEAVRRAGITVGDVDWIIPHQANVRIIDNAAKRLDIPVERIIVNIDRFGNTSAASTPLAMDEAIEDGRIKRGDIVGLVAFGGGLTWGATILRY